MKFDFKRKEYKNLKELRKDLKNVSDEELYKRCGEIDCYYNELYLLFNKVRMTLFNDYLFDEKPTDITKEALLLKVQNTLKTVEKIRYDLEHGVNIDVDDWEFSDKRKDLELYLFKANTKLYDEGIYEQLTSLLNIVINNCTIVLSHIFKVISTNINYGLNDNILNIIYGYDKDNPDYPKVYTHIVSIFKAALVRLESEEISSFYYI